MDDLDVPTYAMALDSMEQEIDGDAISAAEWVRLAPVLKAWLYGVN